jgi:ethanolamine kinase
VFYEQLVFAHCDLLSGNVVIEPKSPGTNGVGENKRQHQAVVNFIDYEYATPSPAAFDLANHFAEWGGFECDYSVLPTRAQRLDFIREYIHTYFSLVKSGENIDEESETQRLFAEVDIFRGVPGFYWGIWALIQATISQIDFDYAQYAEVRLGEYWAWRGELDGTRKAAGSEVPFREKRWAQLE